jgi:uncharacterized protein YkwD
LLLAVILLCLNLILVQGPVLGREYFSPQSSGEWLNLRQARQYMVGLINRDRASYGLPPVELDDVASVVGQRHTVEMALSKYVSHWDALGRKPDQRYSEQGGQAAVSENVLVTHDFAPGENYMLAPTQLFYSKELEQIESLFFNEPPPEDGHRRNILHASHNKVGIGLTMTVPGNRVICAQEFVNQYGKINKVPALHARGASFPVKGELPKGVSVYSVDIYREAAPTPMSTTELRATHSYYLPTERIARYLPSPYTSASRVDVAATQSGERFSVDVRAGQNWTPGLYYVVVWVKRSDSNVPLVTSSQTVAIN